MMRLSKRIAMCILAAAMAVSLMTACGGSDGGSSGDGGASPDHGSSADAGSNEDGNKNDNSTDSGTSGGNKDETDSNGNTGGETGSDGEEEEPQEITIPWEKSQLSKLYYRDVCQEGGTVRLSYRYDGVDGEIQFLRTESSKQGKILEYCDIEVAGKRYLWQSGSWNEEYWLLNDDGTYQVVDKKDVLSTFGRTEWLAIGPANCTELAVQAVEKTHQGKKYYTETLDMNGTKITYYFDGEALKWIEWKFAETQESAWLKDITLQISPTKMDDADCILTPEEKQKVNPETYKAVDSGKKDDSDSGENDGGTTIAWEESLTSKVYPIDIRPYGGTVKMSGTTNGGKAQVKFARTSSRELGKILEYLQANQWTGETIRDTRYLWQMEFADRTQQRWQVYADGTYHPVEQLPSAYTITAEIATGPSSRCERKAVAGKTVYQGKTYYTETFEPAMSGMPFRCIYYYEGTTLKMIQLYSTDSDVCYTNLDLQVSASLMDDADCILTAEEKAQINPDNYTLSENA